MSFYRKEKESNYSYPNSRYGRERLQGSDSSITPLRGSTTEDLKKWRNAVLLGASEKKLDGKESAKIAFAVRQTVDRANRVAMQIFEEKKTFEGFVTELFRQLEPDDPLMSLVRPVLTLEYHPTEESVADFKRRMFQALLRVQEAIDATREQKREELSLERVFSVLGPNFAVDEVEFETNADLKAEIYGEVLEALVQARSKKELSLSGKELLTYQASSTDELITLGLTLEEFEVTNYFQLKMLKNALRNQQALKSQLFAFEPDTLLQALGILARIKREAQETISNGDNDDEYANATLFGKRMPRDESVSSKKNRKSESGNRSYVPYYHQKKTSGYRKYVKVEDDSAPTSEADQSDSSWKQVSHRKKKPYPSKGSHYDTRSRTRGVSPVRRGRIESGNVSSASAGSGGSRRERTCFVCDAPEHRADQCPFKRDNDFIDKVKEFKRSLRVKSDSVTKTRITNSIKSKDLKIKLKLNVKREKLKFQKNGRPIAPDASTFRRKIDNNEKKILQSLSDFERQEWERRSIEKAKKLYHEQKREYEDKIQIWESKSSEQNIQKKTQLKPTKIDKTHQRQKPEVDVGSHVRTFTESEVETSEQFSENTDEEIQRVRNFNEYEKQSRRVSSAKKETDVDRAYVNAVLRTRPSPNVKVEQKECLTHFLDSNSESSFSLDSNSESNDEGFKLRNKERNTPMKIGNISSGMSKQGSGKVQRLSADLRRHL